MHGIVAVSYTHLDVYKRQLYENPAMTKSELGKEKEKIAGQKGLWGRYTGIYNGNKLEKLEAEVDKLIEKAPEQKPEHKYIEAKLTAPQRLEVENFRTWDYTSGWYSWDYETDDKIGFTARVDKGREMDPIIRALSYDDKVGSNTQFVYSQGTFIDEVDLEKDSENQKAFNTHNEEYLDYLRSGIEREADGGFSQEDALAKVDKILDDLSIRDVAVTDCVKAIGNADSESWAGLDEAELPKSVGYSIYLSPKAGDVIGYSLPRYMVYDDLPETTYAPSFLTEQIRVIVTKDGIQKFEWKNISRRKDTIAENTKLLSFDEIKEKLMQHLLYVEVNEIGGEKEKGSQSLYQLEDVQLRAANVNAYEDTEAVWLVPAWIFKVNHTLKDESAGQVYESNIGSEVIILNAIDGGYVTLSFD